MSLRQAWATQQDLISKQMQLRHSSLDTTDLKIAPREQERTDFAEWCQEITMKPDVENMKVSVEIVGRNNRGRGPRKQRLGLGRDGRLCGCWHGVRLEEPMHRLLETRKGDNKIRL